MTFLLLRLPADKNCFCHLYANACYFIHLNAHGWSLHLIFKIFCFTIAWCNMFFCWHIHLKTPKTCMHTGSITNQWYDYQQYQRKFLENHNFFFTLWNLLLGTGRWSVSDCLASGSQSKDIFPWFSANDWRMVSTWLVTDWQVVGDWLASGWWLLVKWLVTDWQVASA